MREIKFRAWDCSDKEMFSHKELGDERVNYGQFFSNQHKAHFKVMQFTGLKDKNDVEIYEGDLLMIRLNSDYPEEIAEIVYEGCCYDARNVRTGVCTFVSNIQHEAKVIGNIYENEELLNE